MLVFTAAPYCQWNCAGEDVNVQNASAGIHNQQIYILCLCASVKFISVQRRAGSTWQRHPPFYGAWQPLCLTDNWHAKCIWIMHAFPALCNAEAGVMVKGMQPVARRVQLVDEQPHDYLSINCPYDGLYFKAQFRSPGSIFYPCILLWTTEPIEKAYF